MDKKVNNYIEKVLKGIWSPFLRNRIRKEIQDHLSDIAEERSISYADSIQFLGEPEDTNKMYKSLMLQKLKHDMFLYGGSLVSIFIIGLLWIHQEVDDYQSHSIREYAKLENNYKSEAISLKHIHRTSEKKNAAAFLSKVVDSAGNIVNEDFLAGINQFDYWEPSELIDSKIMIRLAKFSNKVLEDSNGNAESRRNHKKLAQLIYSTETMIGFRIANNMLDGTLLDDMGRVKLQDRTRANRLSNVTWGLLNLRPSVIGFEKTFAEVNYFKSGVCHHAEDFWFQDSFFKNLTKANLPGERDWAEVLSSVNRIKLKMKNECRLSFLKHVKEPSPMSWSSIYVSGPEDQVFGRIYEQLIATVSTVPYLRNAAGRYIVERVSIGIQGEAKRFYSN